MGRSFLLNQSAGDYRVIDYIGAGGMGEVYRAVHSKIGRVVAIKVLTGEGRNAKALDRFVNEARIQSTLHHPNIASLFDFVYLDGWPCIIMEFVDGQTLSERIRCYGPVLLVEALAFFKSMVEAIGYIHSQGVIHRDIKSNNIKINSTGHVKLLDFGIARSEATPHLTATGDVIGTLHYLSPEQIKGGNADARSDIWAMGVLLYEMLTAQVPFDSPTIGGLCDKICKGAYTQPSILVPSVNREAESIIARCLKKNPAERYQTGGALEQDVDKLLQGLSRQYTPIPIDQQAFEPIRSSSVNTVVAIFSIAMVAVIITIVAFLIWTTPTPSPNNDAGQPTPVASVSVTPRIQNAVSGNIKKTLIISVAEGQADVYRNGEKVGTTPYNLEGVVGEKIGIVLKKPGYVDKSIELEVSENRKEYTYALQNR